METENKNEKRSKMPGGPVTVIVIGAVLITAIICVTVFLLMTSKDRKKIKKLETEIAQLKGEIAEEDSELGEIIELDTEAMEDYELADKDKLGEYYSFTMDGKTYSLPLAFSEFEKTGYAFDEEPAKYEIEGRTSHTEFFYLTDDKDKENAVGSLEVFNPNQNKTKEKDCVIVELVIYQDIDFALGNGITFRTKRSEAQEKLGAVSMASEDEGDAYDVWMLDENGYASLTLNYTDDVVSEIKIDYVGDLDYEYSPEDLEEIAM